MTGRHRWLDGRGSTVRAVLVPLAVACTVLRTVLVPDGYLLQVDASFGPHTAALEWSFYAPVHLLIDVGQTLIGGQAVGRVYVVAALFLCGFGPMLLLRRCAWWAQCVGGLLGMLNPYVYDRLVEGQWGVLVATAGLSFFAVAWLAMGRNPGPRTAAAVTAAAVGVLMFSADFVGPLLVLAIGMLIAKSPRGDHRFRRCVVGSALAILLVSTYGIVGFFVSNGPSSLAGVSQYTAADFQAFASTPAPRVGVVPALLGLYGEWSEGVHRYFVADMTYPWWIGPSAILVLLALLGAIRRRLQWLLVVGAIGVGVSALTAIPFLRDAVSTVATRVAVVAVYREPQKWDALWLLAMVVLVPAGVGTAGRRLPSGTDGARHSLVARVGRLGGPAASVIAVAAIVAPAGWVELVHTGDVVTPVSYPSSWYAAAGYLERAAGDTEPIVVLPWHEYEIVPFVGRPTVDPANVFFPGTLLTSSDPGLPGRPATDPIGAASASGNGCELAAAVRSAGARFVLDLSDVAEGAPDARALSRCGFGVTFEQGDVEILRAPAEG